MEECLVDVKFKVTFKNEEDEIITETITVELDGFCEGYYIDSGSLEISIEHFLDNCTLQDIQYHIVGNEVKEIIDIKEI